MSLRIALQLTAVQQQFIFDRQLRFAAEQPVHFALSNSKLFSLGVLSPVQPAIDVQELHKHLASLARGIFNFKVIVGNVSLRVVTLFIWSRNVISLYKVIKSYIKKNMCEYTHALCCIVR